jgi:hypothetical protein
MKTHPKIHDAVEDVMHRRTALPLRECFSWGSHNVNLTTNSPAVLSAAAYVGFASDNCAEVPSDLQWEIVAEPSGHAPVREPCKIVQSAQSIYLSIGPYQWFAFDREAKTGAGFVTTYDLNWETDRGIVHYLRSVIAAIGDSLRNQLDEVR